MMGSLLIRGMLVGILAGLLAFGFAKVFGEPQVDKAIAFEEAHSREADKPAAMPGMAMPNQPEQKASDAAPANAMPGMQMGQSDQDQGDVELVSRPMQASFGLLTGVLTYGIAMGGMFALVFAFAQGRLGRLTPRGTAALIAMAGFAAVVIIPQLKYPANPPAIGNPETIGPRTALYFGMLAISVLSMIVAFMTAQGLAQRFGRWNGTLIAAAIYLAIAFVAMLVLPAVNEVPSDFSADVLWRFRVASLGIHVVLWTTYGIVFGIVAERLLQRRV
ncbi:CbtA family protein [Methylovirgula sp. 4M-Z18]|uniref:CbtA family protein n=1 Tax=Methylovirgula sp. 4M-Z18 TaxID=2293567 RepID=UPI000E2E563E|nr:CbtA family protein [Methylovirgula sp. 4M-Z18]RFB81300.1 hypothetical protein DYH55_07650 [Methylovirgula sp. 4M-Z18]